MCVERHLSTSPAHTFMFLQTKSPPHARPAEISVHLTDLGMTVFDFGGKIDAAPPVMTRAQQTGSVQRPPGAKAQSRSVEKRKSPMRSFRKYFAKTTGLHGFFSKNQKMDPNTSVPAHILQSGQGIGQKPTNPRVQPPSTGDSNRAGMPPRQSQQASPQETRMTSQQRTPQGAAPPSSGDDNDNNRRQPLFPGSMDAHAQLAQSQSPSRSFGSDAPSTARP